MVMVQNAFSLVQNSLEITVACPHHNGPDTIIHEPDVQNEKLPYLSSDLIFQARNKAVVGTLVC